MLSVLKEQTSLRLIALIHVKRRHDMNQTFKILKPKVALIQACWHFDIVDKAREGFLTELGVQGVDASGVNIFKVPGAYDIPLMAKRLCESGQYSAVVATGFIVDGGIYRHDFVSTAVIDGLMRVQLDTDVPVLSVVLTPHNFQETDDHEAFFREHFVKKGEEAARACVQIIGNFEQLAAA